jgi:hypothetical protein
VETSVEAYRRPITPTRAVAIADTLKIMVNYSFVQKQQSRRQTATIPATFVIVGHIETHRDRSGLGFSVIDGQTNSAPDGKLV